MFNYKDLDVTETSEARSALRAMNNCKHETINRVSSDIQDTYFCNDCEKTWTESELAYLHAEENPQVLDDDLPDHFSDWIGERTTETINVGDDDHNAVGLIPTQDFSFTYIRRGHPTQIISTRASSLEEAVDNMSYQMERFGFTKADIRKELLNG